MNVQAQLDKLSQKARVDVFSLLIRLAASDAANQYLSVEHCAHIVYGGDSPSFLVMKDKLNALCCLNFLEYRKTNYSKCFKVPNNVIEWAKNQPEYVELNKSLNCP